MWSKIVAIKIKNLSELELFYYKCMYGYRVIDSIVCFVFREEFLVNCVLIKRKICGVKCDFQTNMSILYHIWKKHNCSGFVKLKVLNVLK